MTDQDKTKPHRVVDAEGKTTLYLGKVGMSMSAAQSKPTKKEDDQ
jgi:hypothetical protein